MADETRDNLSASVSDLARMVRLSRASIQYYEKVGVLDPRDADNRHRYPMRDITRVTNTIALRNLGVELSEIVPLLDDEPFSERHLLEYRASVERRRAYLDAQIEMLDRYVALLHDDGAVQPCEMEASYFTPTVPWSAETGTSEAGEEPMYAPVSGMGAVFEGKDFTSPVALRGGRAVFVRFASLISGFGEGMEIIGGCSCIAAVLDKDTTFGGDVRPSDWAPLFARFRAYMRAHALRAAGQAFIPYGLSIYGIPRALVCLPVERAGVLGRLGLRR